MRGMMSGGTCTEAQNVCKAGRDADMSRGFSMSHPAASSTHFNNDEALQDPLDGPGLGDSLLCVDDRHVCRQGFFSEQGHRSLVGC